MTKPLTPPTPKPSRQNSAKKPQRGSAARDLLVRLTIPLVTAALTFGLHLQLNLDLSVAALIALLAGTSLALMHVTHQRGAMIRDLRRELLRATGPSQMAMRNAHALPMGQSPSGAPYGVPQTTSAGPDRALNDQSFSPQYSQVKETPPLRGAVPVPNGPPPAIDEAAELKRPDLPVPAMAVPAERAPWFARESLEPAPRLEMPRPQQQTAPQGDLPPPLPPSLDAGDFESHMKPDASIGPRGIAATGEPAPGATSPARETRIVPMPIDRIASASVHQQSAVETDERTMAPFWALRPGVAPDPMPASLNETHGRGDGQKNGVGDLKPGRTNVFQVIDVDEPTVPYLRLARPPAAEAVDGPELEAMQKLIQQLATQLNGPREEAPEQPKATIQQPEVRAEDVHPSGPTVAQSVATSVAALRATAETMRAAKDSAPPSRIAMPQPPVPAPEPENSVSGAASQAPDMPERVVSSPRKPVQDDAVPRHGRNTRIAQASAAIADERIDVLLEPIMGLGDRKARHFEVSVRLRDESGAPIDASDLAEIAADGGIMPKLDAAKMVRTARVANRLQARGTGASLFSTLAGESLADPAFLDIFDGVFAGEPALSSRLVLSFSQNEVRQFSDGHWDAIESMADMGLRLALEDVTDLDMDFEALREHGFDFVKLDARVFLEGLQAPEGLLPAPEICRHFANMGLALIVGHIEDETSLAKVFGFGVLFGQGDLFGGARPVSIDTSSPPRTAAA